MQSWNVSMQMQMNHNNLIKISLKIPMYNENNSNFEFVEMQDIHGCLKEEDVIILELLQHIVNRELMLNLIMTTIY